MVAPLLASAMPKLAVKVVLPTPPFPEQINIVRVFSATKFKDFSNNKATLEKVKYLKIKFRGDGNIYKLRLRQNNRRASYSTDFKSIKNKWVEMDLNIDDFKPYWRGYSFYNYPALDLREINSLGIQISDKQEGDFNLEIKYIKGIY